MPAKSARKIAKVLERRILTASLFGSITAAIRTLPHPVLPESTVLRQCLPPADHLECSLKYLRTATSDGLLLEVQELAQNTPPSDGDGKAFKHGRQFAAWLGLVPQHYSSGGKTRLGPISQRGNGYFRTLLIHGARRGLQLAGHRTDAKRRGAEPLKPRRGHNIAAVALAAKHVRIIWAMLAQGQACRRATSRRRVCKRTRGST